MTSKETISVIIPSYNREATLLRALKSVYTQTRKPDEVIVIDDGSTDNTSTIIKRDFPQTQYIYQANRGVSAARNRGIQHTTGQWLAFLDSDDEWLPNKLERQLDALALQLEHKAIHTDEIWIRNGERVNPMKKHAKSGGMIFKQCLPLCSISPSSVMLHRSLFDEIGYFDETLPACEDYDLWLRLCAKFPILFVNEPLLKKYGGHRDRLSQKHCGMDRFRITALEKILQSDQLNKDNQQAAIDMLILKANVLLQGARKREKNADLDRYEILLQRYINSGTTA